MVYLCRIQRGFYPGDFGTGHYIREVGLGEILSNISAGLDGMYGSKLSRTDARQGSR